MWYSQEKFSLKMELQEVMGQVSQQSEYCSSMGAACSTLLWRVSRCEDSIQAILGGVRTTSHIIMLNYSIFSFTGS